MKKKQMKTKLILLKQAVQIRLSTIFIKYIEPLPRTLGRILYGFVNYSLMIAPSILTAYFQIFAILHGFSIDEIFYVAIITYIGTGLLSCRFVSVIEKYFGKYNDFINDDLFAKRHNTLCTEEREDAAKLRQYNVRLLRAPLPGNKPIMKQAKKPFTKQAKKPFKLTKKQLTKQRLLRFALKQKQKRLTLGFRLQPRIEISHITENDILTKFVSITGGEAIFLTVLVILKKKLRKNPTRVLVAALQRLRPLVKTTTQIRAGKPIYHQYINTTKFLFLCIKFLKESAWNKPYKDMPLC
jgi:hypothetical protein